MTVGGASGSPAVFQGEASRQGAGALTPYPMLPAAIPPSVEGTGRERYLQNPWRGGIPVAGQMHLGITYGGSQGRGRGIDPFPDVSRRRHTARRRGNRQGKAFANPWKGGIPVAWQMHLGVTHGGRKGRGGALTPSPTFPAAMPPRVGGTGREGICKIHGEAGSQWLGKCILGSHTGAARGEGGALAP